MINRVKRKILSLRPEPIVRTLLERKVRSVFKSPGGPVVLIYQMGKVGSTSLYMALKKTEIKTRLFHVHFISDQITEVIDYHRSMGVKPLPSHLFIGQQLNRELLTKPKKEFRIISMVRDPISMIISGAFQNPKFSKIKMCYNSDIEPLVAQLNQLVNKKKNYDYIFNWFDKEIRMTFDFDVYSINFNFDEGWGTQHSGRNRLLIIQTEKLDQLDFTVLNSFVDCKVDNVERTNSRANQSPTLPYKAILTNISPTEEIIDYVYNSRFVKSFYSSNDIEIFVSKWKA